MESRIKQHSSNLSRFLRPKFGIKKERRGELQLTIKELEAKEAELNESSYRILQVPHIEDGISSVEGGNRKIFDISGDTLALDNIEFQLVKC